MNWTKTQISILGIVAIASFLSTFLISSVSIALPAIEKEFELNAITLSWMVTSFLLALAMFLLPAGRLADITGVKKMFKAGVAIFTISSLLCALAPSGVWLIIFRYLQGVGGALSSTTGPAILVAAFLPQFRGRVLGISVSAVYLGLAFGPFAGGIITEYLGWRYLFFFSFAAGVAVTIITWLYLGKDEFTDIKPRHPRLWGTLFYMIGLVALVYGSSRIPLWHGWLAMAIGLLALVMFWLLENYSKMPVFDTRLFTQNRLFAFSNIAALINYSSTFAIIFLLSLYLQKIKVMSPFDAGFILIAQPIVMAVFSPISGRLSDKFQPRIVATVGMAMCALGLLGMGFFTDSTPMWLIVALLIWVGLGYAFFSSPNMNTIMSSVPKTLLGTASGTSASMRVVGQIISMTIATIFFAIMFGNKAVEAIPNDLFLQAMQWTFITFTLISFTGVYFSFSRGKLER